MKFYVKTILNDEYTYDVKSFMKVLNEIHIITMADDFILYPKGCLIEFRMCE